MVANYTAYRRRRKTPKRHTPRRDDRGAALIAATYVPPIEMLTTIILSPGIRFVGEPLATGLPRS